MVKLKKLFSIKRHTAAAEDSDDQSRPLSQVHSDEAQIDSLGESAQAPSQEWGDWSGHGSSEEGSRKREPAGKKKTSPLKNFEKMKLRSLSAFALAPRRNNDDDSIASFASMRSAQERRYFGAGVQSVNSRSSISDFRSEDDTAATDTELELAGSKRRKDKKKSKKHHKTSSKKKISKKETASATSSTADVSEDPKELTSSPSKRRTARRMSSKVGQILEDGIRSPRSDDISQGGDSRTVSSRASSVRRKKKSKKSPSRSSSVASSRSSRPPRNGKKTIHSKTKIKYQKRDDQSVTSEITDVSQLRSPFVAKPNKKGKKKKSTKCDDQSVTSEITDVSQLRSPFKVTPNKKGKKKNKRVDAEGQVGNGGSTSIPKQIDTGDSSDEKKGKVALHKERSAADPLPSPPNRKRSAVKGKGDGQREEVLKLQHQLSEALQKVVTSTEEHIADKSQFLKVSKELSHMKISLEEMAKERDDLQDKLKERDEVVETSMQRIDKLEQAIERQLDQQDELEAKLERSDDEIEKLLIEVKDLESAVEGNGATPDTEGLRADLKDKKKELIDKQRMIDDQKSKIGSLQQEVENADVANKLQIEELQVDKRSLQAKLRGEKLDAAAKSEKFEATIGDLQKQLATYKGDSEAQDAADVREKLFAVQAALEASLGEVDLVSSSYQQVKDEKDDLQEKNSVLNEQIQVLERNVKEQSEKSADLENKVIQWTEKTYAWKTKAENAERKAGTMVDQSQHGSENGEAVNEAPQGLFLQSVMDKQEVKMPKKIWSVFSRNNNAQEGDEQLSPEDIRIRETEKRNDSLEDAITELKSDIEQLKTDHKDEVFSLKDQISTLGDDNEALKRKNETLTAICESKNGD